MDVAIRRSFGFFGQEKIFHLNAPASLKGAQHSNRDLMDFREDILLYSLSSHKYQYISGHFRYSEKIYKEFHHDWQFVTSLRNPVSKWISQYFYNRYKDTTHFKLDYDLESFLDSEQGQSLGSDFVQKLTDKKLGLDPTSDKAIEVAAKNLDNFSLVGFVEDFASFSKDYKNIFGVDLKIKSRNSNPVSKSQQKEKISSVLRERIEEICKPDMALYEMAAKKWNPSVLNRV